MNPLLYLILPCLLLSMPGMADETDDLIYSLQEQHRHQQMMNELRALRETQSQPTTVAPAPQVIYVERAAPREQAPRYQRSCYTDARLHNRMPTQACLDSISGRR